jgi:hypothetical protein
VSERRAEELTVPEQPDADHRRPDGADDATVEAVGKVSEAYEWIVRARGALYDFHQMMGRADGILGEGLDRLREAGHGELADELGARWLGRNALPDLWTFEIMERFDDTYFAVATEGEQRVREELMDGRRHVHESEMKAARREGARPSDD